MRKLPRKSCENCGKPRLPAYTRFCSRACKTAVIRGIRHFAWRGGKNYRKDGYVGIMPESGSLIGLKGSNRYKAEHRAVAEKAVGYKLPREVPVHHHDQNRANNANTNLVICQDQKYHELLHHRMEVIEFGGDPNVQSLCRSCGTVKLLSEFGKISTNSHGVANWCKECRRAYERARYIPKIRAKHYNRSSV